MPPAATAKTNRELNPEEFFGGEEQTQEEMLDERRAVKLKQERAAARKEIEHGTLGTLNKIPTPVENEPELVPQEYGRPTEAPGAEEGEAPEESGEDTEPEEGEKGAEPEETEEEQEEQIQDYITAASRAKSEKDKEIYQLLAMQTMVRRRMQNLNATLQEKIKPAEKALRLSKLKDRTRNLVRALRVLGGIGFTPPLVFTIILPLLMLLAMLAVLILWLCGFNLGAPSLKTMELKKKFDSENKTITVERKTRMMALQKEMAQISKEINQLLK